MLIKSKMPTAKRIYFMTQSYKYNLFICYEIRCFLNQSLHFFHLGLQLVFVPLKMIGQLKNALLKDSIHSMQIKIQHACSSYKKIRSGTLHLRFNTEMQFGKH